MEKRAARIEQHYGAAFKPEALQLELFHVSGFVHPLLNVITSEEPHWIQQFQWGLIPAWCKDVTQAKQISVKTLNAKCETIFTKPSFRSILKKRCLVIVNGFYEWHTIGKKKFPFYVSLNEQDFFSLGGLYEHWVDVTSGEIKNTFSIITTEANPLMAKIHNTMKRMPFIVPVENEKKWIDSSLTKEDIKTLMQPFDETKMQAYPVSKRITDRKQNSNVPEVMERFDYAELDVL
jgi:putative SOS response-associated peptidase YedK